MTLALGASACFGGFDYVVKDGKPPALKTDTFTLSVTRLEQPMCLGLALDIVVKNVTDHVAWFDPAGVSITNIKNGRSYAYSNKMQEATASVFGYTPNVWDKFNVAWNNPLPPGATYAAKLWYETEPCKENNIELVNVKYGNQTLRFPP